MMDEKNSYFEISLPALFEITNDILTRVVRAGFSENYLKECVVRIPKDQNENRLTYDLGFPQFPF